MARSNEPTCGTRLLELRRLRAGELAADVAATVRAHAESCDHCSARIAELDAEQQLFAATIDIAQESVAVVAKLDAPEPRATRSWRFLIAPALAFAIAGILALPTPKNSDEDDGVRIKGISPSSTTVALQMYVKDAAGIREAGDGTRLREGDAVQFRYDAGGRDYLMVVSLGSDGTLSPLYPERPGNSIRITPRGLHVLEGSVILDAARGPERFFAFFSATPLSYEEVARELKEELSKESDVTRLREVELERQDVAEKSVLIIKE